MLSLVRYLARKMIIVTEEVKETASWVRQNFRTSDQGLIEAVNQAGPHETILHISTTRNVKDHSCSFLVKLPCEDILQTLLNHPPRDVEFSVQLVPRSILFRVTGRSEIVLEQILNDFKGKPGKLQDWIIDSVDKGTAIHFTERSLNRNVTIGDILEDIIYIDGLPTEVLFRNLQWRALSYFNESLENRDWNLVEIRIYDSHGQYRLHLERLKLVLEALEVGIAIGEGWGKDYAHILMPVKVYTLRILTFFDLSVIKKALMGLEYQEEGERFVDLDLYHNKRKFSWTSIAFDKQMDRKDHSRLFRRELMQALTGTQIEEIEKIEKKIMDLHIPKEGQ